MPPAGLDPLAVVGTKSVDSVLQQGHEQAVKFRLPAMQVFHIDHIMVGNKFIYCIRDRYYPGAIAAKEEDPNWIFYSGKKAIYIQNPMLINKIRVERLSMMTGFDSRFLVSIVLINDDCMMTPIENTYSDNFLVSLKNLPSFISYMESQNVDPLDPHAAAVAVHDLSELNLRGKLKNE